MRRARGFVDVGAAGTRDLADDGTHKSWRLLTLRDEEAVE